MMRACMLPKIRPCREAIATQLAYEWRLQCGKSVLSGYLHEVRHLRRHHGLGWRVRLPLLEKIEVLAEADVFWAVSEANGSRTALSLGSARTSFSGWRSRDSFRLIS